MILNRLIYLIGVSSIAVGLLFGCSNTANVGSDEIENYSAKQIYDRAEYEMARLKLKTKMIIQFLQILNF